MENSKHYVMNEEIMEDLVSCLKGNSKALDIMTDFTTAFIYLFKNNENFGMDTLFDFQSDLFNRLTRRYNNEEDN